MVKKLLKYIHRSYLYCKKKYYLITIFHIGKNDFDYCDLKHNEIIYFINENIYFEINFIPVIPAGNDDANSHPNAINYLYYINSYL